MFFGDWLQLWRRLRSPSREEPAGRVEGVAVRVHSLVGGSWHPATAAFGVHWIGRKEK